MIDLGENIIIIWKLSKSRSVAPAKLEIKLVSPNNTNVLFIALVDSAHHSASDPASA